MNSPETPDLPHKDRRGCQPDEETVFVEFDYVPPPPGTQPWPRPADRPRLTRADFARAKHEGQERLRREGESSSRVE